MSERQPFPKSDALRWNDLLYDDSLEIVKEILPDDPMYRYAPESYFEIGREAFRCILKGAKTVI